MPDSAAPSTSFRLLTPQIFAVASGLRVLLMYCDEFPLDHYDSGLDDRVKALARLLVPLSDKQASMTHRIHLDALEIAMCMFALRSLRREIKLGLIRSLFWPCGVSFPKLMKKLEKHRKRAKRAWLSGSDPATYKDWQNRWHRFLKGMHYKPPPPVLPGYYRRRLEMVLATVKGVLATNNEPVPDDRRLRLLVRKMLRHVRQYRAPITRRDLWNANDKARLFISTYMPEQIRKQRAAEYSAPESPFAAGGGVTDR